MEQPKAEIIREQVARIAAWDGISSADRLGRFLAFTVEKVLAGRGEDIKEYTLGVDVCGRPASFDPRSESVVRNTASRLRSKLREYYLTVGFGDPIEIEIPKGAYVPQFHWRTPLPEGRASSTGPIRQPWVLYAGMAALLVGVGLLIVLTLRARSVPAVNPAKFEVTPPAGYTFVSFSLSGPAALSPDGTKIAFVAAAAFVSGGEPDRAIFVRSIESGEIKRMERTRLARNIFWSPDSASLGFFADGKLYAAALAGGSPRLLCEAPYPQGATWNRNGDILFASRLPGGILRTQSTGGAPSALTQPSNGETGHAWPYFLPDGKHFLYTVIQSQPGPSTVYLSRIDSPSWRKPLLKSSSNAVFADVAPGSSYLLYVSGNALVGRRFDSDRMEPTGDVISIEPSVDLYPWRLHGDFSISQNAMLAFRLSTQPADRKLVWLNRAGEVIQEIPGKGLYRFPAIAPDGKKIAVEVIDRGQTTGDLWLLGAANEHPVRLTFDPRSDCCPYWSPDGGRLVFSSPRSGPGDLFWKAALPGAPDELLIASASETRPTSWSADGRFLMLQMRAPNQSTDLWALPLAEPRTPFPVVQSPAEELDGSISPDGRWITYYSDEPERWQIFVERFRPDHKSTQVEPGSRQRIEVAQGTDPRWRRDGRELFFISNGALQVAAVEGGEQFRVRSIKRLFSVTDYFHRGFGYAVSPDGQRFLFSASATKEPLSSPAVNIVLNWSGKLPR